VKRVDSFLNVLTTIMVTGTCQKWGTRNSRPRKIKGSKATEAPRDIPLDRGKNVEVLERQSKPRTKRNKR
jgi:hypothetical protein